MAESQPSIESPVLQEPIWVPKKHRMRNKPFKYWIMGSLLICIIGFQPQTSPAQVNKEPMIDIKMEVNPSEFEMADIDEVRVTLGAINKGKKTLPTKLDYCQLYINDEISFAWNLTIGNGLRPYEWYDLPGQDTVSLTWPTLAKSLFTEPGTYQLRLEVEEKVVQELKVVCKGDQQDSQDDH